MLNTVEIVSPLMFRDITSLCRISKNGMVAECFVCGTVMHGNVHLCEVAYGGFFCCRCCPAHNGLVKLTAEEVAAMEANRRGGMDADAKRQRAERRRAQRERERRTQVTATADVDVGFVCPGTNLDSGRRWRAYVAAHPTV
jgi:hypothetical protein